MTPTPPCACGHIATLHMPHGGGGRCTGAGCDCRAYVRRTTRPDELLPPAEAEWNPTDDELRDLVQDTLTDAAIDPTIRDLARLVLREREETRRMTAAWRNECDKHLATIERAEQAELDARNHLRERDAAHREVADRTAERDQARAALARVEALCERSERFKTDVLAAIAGDTPLLCANCGKPGRDHEGELFTCHDGALTYDEAIRLGVDLARRAATPPEARP